MPVHYDSKALIPAPFATIKQGVTRSADGVARARSFIITLKGKLCAQKGSPRADGTFWTSSGYPPTDITSLTDANRLAIMRDKMGAIQQLFSVDGKWLEIQPYDGSAPIKAQTQLLDIEWDEGNWYDVLPFTISLQAECIWFGDKQVCPADGDGVAPEETWNLEQVDEYGRTYRLTHSVTHQARRQYASDGTVAIEGWQVALGLCKTRLGFQADMLLASGVLDLTGHQPFNYARAQQVDEAQGKVTLSETWLCFDPGDTYGGATAGVAVEECNVESRYSVDTGLWTVSVTGTINGLEQRDPVSRELQVTRFDNATSRFAQLSATDGIPLTRAQAYSGVTLNPVPKGRSMGQNPKTGVITYSWEFDQRPALSDPSFLSELYTVQIDHAADVFAAIGVLNRPAGPILQPIGSKTQKSITVSADIVIKAVYGQPLPSPPAYNPLPTTLQYIGSPSQLFVQTDRENWVARAGRYSRSTTFVYQ